MAVYRVKAPDGHVVEIKGPEGAADAEVMAQAAKLYKPKTGREGLLAKIDAHVGGLAKGALGNFDDEITAGINTVLPVDALAGNDVRAGWQSPKLADIVRGEKGGFQGAYEHNLRQARKVDKVDAELHPGARGTGEVGGAILSVLGVGKALKAAAPVVSAAVPAAEGVLARIAASRAGQVAAKPVARAAASGAGYGYVSGFGAGDTLENRKQSGAIGAITGAALGAGLHTVATAAAPVVKRYVDAFMGNGATQEALRQIRNALAKEGYDVSSPAGVKALKTELDRYTDKPVALADLGPNLRNRAAVGLRSPSAAQGPALDAINARTAGQAARLRKDITDTVAPRTDVHALDDALVEQRATAALPLKQKALYDANPTAGAPTTGSEVPIVVGGRQLNKNLAVTGQEGARVPVVPDDEVLQQLARLPMAQRALDNARAITAAERDRLNVTGGDISHLPDFPEKGAPLDMRALDYLKRTLDDEVRGAYQSTDSGVRAQAPQLQALRDEIRDRMRTQGGGEYGQYLDQYAGTSELRDALEAGRGAGATTGSRNSVPGFDQMDPEVIAREQAKRSEAGQEFYRVGAARRLTDIVNKATDPQYPSARILNSPEARAQLEATGVAPEAQARLQEAVGQENTLNLLPRTTRGIGAQVSGAAAADADAGLATTVPYNFVSPRNWLAIAAQKAFGKVNLARNAKVNEAALPRLIETNPQAIQNTINDLVASGDYAAARRLATQAKMSFTAKLVGSAAGSPVSLQEEK